MCSGASRGTAGSALGETARARAEIDGVVAENPGVTPAAYAEMVALVSGTPERAGRHLAGLRRAGWSS